MTNYNYNIRFLIFICIGLLMYSNDINAQENEYTLSGKVLESGSGTPLQQAIISVASTSKSTNSNEDGAFSINLPSSQEKIMVSYPGYHPAEIFTFGQAEVTIYLIQEQFESGDKNYTNLFGTEKIKDAINTVTNVSRTAIDLSATTSLDQALSGKIAGLHIVEHSGMPGHNSWVNLRGVSSVFAQNEPLVFIDGVIHQINYPKNDLLEGHLVNPFDIIELEDVVDVSAIKTGIGSLGSAGSNGQLYINTKQNQSTGSAILFKMYGGVAFKPKSLDLMNASQFKPYFNELLVGEGYNNDQINSMYPWLNGDGTSDEYYRYNNNTNWQEELFKPAALQKYYIFLKGGDDIATYNISSGFLTHDASYEDWKYTRYNLRLNGRVNLTKKIFIEPNTKISLSDSYLSNMGPTIIHNPVSSALLKSPLMTANERSEIDGSFLQPYDDVGVFNMSNPAALADNASGSDRNFQLMSSVKAGVDITSKLNASYLIATSVNNGRSNIFIPEVGVVQVDSIRNSPQDMVTEFRSLQNHATLSYINTFNNQHRVNLYGGLRHMNNSYKNNQGYDLNTPSDHFSSLGQGTEYRYLRTNGGENSELLWMSYYGDFSYAFRDKYYIRASLSYDGSSVFNSKNRYNFYPSVFAAWRISSESFLNNSIWLNDLKLRAAYSQTGNMFSGAYESSKLTYTGRRFDNVAVPIRDFNPNENLEAERKSTINVGMDFGFAKKAINLHVDYHMSSINNLIINQSLPYNYGFTDYLDNGGALNISGLEVSADARMHAGELIILIDASITSQQSIVNSLDFINPETESLIREVYGAEYIGSEGNAINNFYGYKTNGILSQANGVIGPNGRPLEAGDVNFEDVDGNGIINDADKQIIGNPNPELFGSFGLSAVYKRFELSSLLTYSMGNDVFNFVDYQLKSMDSYANQSPEVLDRWTPSNTDATLPKATMGDPVGNNVFSDRWIEDGSYLRVRQITLSYTTPNLFSLQKETKFYITGSNLFTFTEYTGYDPETMYQSSPYYMGIDYGKIPLAKSVIIGLQISL